MAVSNSTFPTTVGGPSASGAVLDFFGGGEPQHSDALGAMQAWAAAADAHVAANPITSVNALGVLGNATGAMKLGFNSVTNTASDTTTLQPPPNPVAGDRFQLLATNAATHGTWAWTTTPKKAGGSFALSATNSAVDYVEFMYDGAAWVAYSISLAIS